MHYCAHKCNTVTVLHPQLLTLTSSLMRDAELVSVQSHTMHVLNLMSVYVHRLTPVMFTKVGFPLRYCHIQKPWETPYDLEELQRTGKIKPSRLAMGSSVDDYVMINDPKIGECLHNLVYGAKGKIPSCKYSIGKDQGKQLSSWLSTNRRELIPFIPLVSKKVTVQGQVTEQVSLGESVRGIIEVWSCTTCRHTHFAVLSTSHVYTYTLLYMIHANMHIHTEYYYSHKQVVGHWATCAPELKLLPANLITCVQSICQASSITPAEHTLIVTHSTCLGKLIQHGTCTEQTLDTQSGAKSLSQRLVALLKVMIQKSQACLTGKTPIIPRDWHSTQMPFEEMVCSGTFGPAHPACCCLPFFKYDYECKQEVERYAKNRAQELSDLDQVLREQSQRMGSTCQKHKTKQTVLSSGVFTILCNRCGVIEYFELMCQPESPATPARAIFHRAWRPSDIRARG